MASRVAGFSVTKSGPSATRKPRTCQPSTRANLVMATCGRGRPSTLTPSWCFRGASAERDSYTALAFMQDVARRLTQRVLRRLGSSGSCGAGYARGEAPLGLREIDDGTIGIEDVPSTLFNVGIYQ